MTTVRMYIFINFSSIEAPLDVWVYISRTVLILPLGACIETATGRMGL